MLLKAASASSVLLLVLGACGSRSTLLPGEIPAEVVTPDAGPLPECNVDEDCGDTGDLCGPLLCDDGQCVQRFTLCNDGDPCTKDACEPTTGQCVTTDATLDLDGDGHKGPLPGTVPGAPGSCGDDCDDTRDAAFPGNTEICDSVDNDCNGVIDDGAGYAPPTGGPSDVRVSSAALERATPGGLAHDGTRYFATYEGDADSRSRAYGQFLQGDGTSLSAESRLVQVESDTFPSSTLWTGDRYAVLWSDRRSSNYEVFFAMFDPSGKKMNPGDIRLSNSEGFSINPDFVFTGTEFVAVWQDGTGDNGSFRVVAQRIGLDGALLGGVSTLATGESPRIAVGRPGLGVVYTGSGDDRSEAFFRPIDYDLTPLADPVLIQTPVPAAYPTVRFNTDAFVVTWSGVAPPFQMYGATFDGLGAPVVPAKQLTASPGNARFGSMIPLGDRLLMVYSDDRDGNEGYEIYSQTYGTDLLRVGLPTRITDHVGNSTQATPIAGPQGEIGVLFADQRDGNAQTYFTRLVCN